MLLLLTWVFLPLADFTMGARGKAQWTGFALLAMGFAAVADRRAKKSESNADSGPIRLAGIELRTLTPEEIGTIPKGVFVLAFAIPLAIFLALGDSWIAVPLALTIGGLLGLAMARYAQQADD